MLSQTRRAKEWGLFRGLIAMFPNTASSYGKEMLEPRVTTKQEDHPLRRRVPLHLHQYSR